MKEKKCSYEPTFCDYAKGFGLTVLAFTVVGVLLWLLDWPLDDGLAETAFEVALWLLGVGIICATISYADRYGADGGFRARKK